MLQDGAMVNQGAVSASLDATNKNYTIPAGYHDGSGKVSVTTQTKSVTPSSAQQTVYPDSGKLLSAVTVAAQSGKMVYSGTVSSTTEIFSSVNTGVALSDGDIFIMFRTNNLYFIDYGNASNYYILAYRASSSENLFLNVNANESGYTDYSDVVGTLSGTITYSGTTVSVTGAMHKGEYAWYLIKA